MSKKTYNEEVETILGSRLEKLDSASLRASKFTVIEEKSNKKQEEGNKKQFEDIARLAKRNSGLFPKSRFELPDSESFKMKLMGRMMVDQAEGVFENAGLKLHRFFGYPFIPGSALKGIARHAAWWEWSNSKDKSLALEIAEIFGFPTGEKELDDFLEREGVEDARGKAAFLHATPCDDKWSIVVDILTSHGGSDTKNPVPVNFPAVEKGATFLFQIASTSPDTRAKTVKWLKMALEEDGVGAKTSAGYGWFKEV